MAKIRTRINTALLTAPAAADALPTLPPPPTERVYTFLDLGIRGIGAKKNANGETLYTYYPLDMNRESVHLGARLRGTATYVLATPPDEYAARLIARWFPLAKPAPASWLHAVAERF